MYFLLVYWMWELKGWFYEFDVVDVVGCGLVYFVGGFSGLVVMFYFKFCLGKFDENNCFRFNIMVFLINVMFGMFMLWWGWFGFNCGSMFGIIGGKWKFVFRLVIYVFFLLCFWFVE